MKKQQKKKHPPSKLKGAYLQQKTKTNEQQQQQKLSEVYDITNKFPEYLGTSLNWGSTVLRTIRTVR